MDKTNLPPLPDRLEHEALTLEAESRIEANAGCSTNTPDRRAALLREAARAVREAVPDGMVLVPRGQLNYLHDLLRAINRDEDGDNYLNDSADALEALEPLLAAPTQDQENGS